MEEYFIDFLVFEVLIKKMKHATHEKIVFIEDSGQFGGFHRIPEVKTYLCTTYQANT